MTAVSNQTPLETPLTVKFVVVGNMGVGKTSFIGQYIESIFLESYKATVGVDFKTKDITYTTQKKNDSGEPIKEEKKVKLQLWDIAGQERFGTMTSSYYRAAHAAIVVFDVTDQKSYEAAMKWKEDIEKKNICFPGTKETIPMILVANKMDLLKGETPSYRRDFQAKSQEYGFLSCKETSAQSGEGIEDVINSLMTEILPKLKPEEKDSIRLHQQVKKQDSSCCFSS